VATVAKNLFTISRLHKMSDFRAKSELEFETYRDTSRKKRSFAAENMPFWQTRIVT